MMYVGKDIDDLWPVEALAVAMLINFFWVNAVLSMRNCRD
jgi:hypothetical protein